MQTYEFTDIDIKNDKEFCKNIAQCCNEESIPDFLDGFFSYLKKVKLDDALKRGYNSISTQNYVGVIRYKRFQIDILPKLLKRDESRDCNTVLSNLMFMLSYTKRLDINTTNISPKNVYNLMKSKIK